MNVALARNLSGGPQTLDGERNCGLHFEPLILGEAVQRFQQEARRAEFHNGRTSCSFYSWGEGPALVCVPGLADDSLSFVPLAAYLSQRFRVIAYDWPTGANGESQVRHYRHQDFVADFWALVDHLQLETVLPLGYSFGSTVVLQALRQQPARVPRAVLVGGFARRRLAPAERMLASMARYWHGRVRHIPLVHWILQAGRKEAFYRREKALWKYYLERNGSLPIQALAQRTLVLDRTDLRAQLPETHQPVLLICGDGDPMVGKRCEADLLTGLPNVSRVELQECGHLSIYTHCELVAELATAFFNDSAGKCAV